MDIRDKKKIANALIEMKKSLGEEFFHDSKRLSRSLIDYMCDLERKYMNLLQNAIECGAFSIIESSSQNNISHDIASVAQAMEDEFGVDPDLASEVLDAIAIFYNKSIGELKEERHKASKMNRQEKKRMVDALCEIKKSLGEEFFHDSKRLSTGLKNFMPELEKKYVRLLKNAIECDAFPIIENASQDNISYAIALVAQSMEDEFGVNSDLASEVLDAIAIFYNKSTGELKEERHKQELTYKAEENVTSTRKIVPVIYVLDTSGSMAGERIKKLNEVMKETIEVLEEVSADNADAEIKVNVLDFSTSSRWVYPTLTALEDCCWNDLTAGGLKALGSALKELDDKLSRSSFLSGSTEFSAPVIIFVCDGESTDCWKETLLKINQTNKWFSHATKIAFALGDDDKDALAQIVGRVNKDGRLVPNAEAVIQTSDVETLKKLIRVVSVSVSMV